MAKIQKKIETTIPFNSIFLFSTQRLSIREPPNYLPTEATEPTEVSGARYSPTDCTDIHRLGGYGIPAIPTQPLNYLPTEFTEPTEVSDARYSPPEASVKICAICGRISSARNFCEFREFCGRTCANKLRVGSVEGIRSAAWVWQGCHTLLRKLPRIARMCTD